MKKWLLFLAIAIGVTLFILFQAQSGRGPSQIGQGLSPMKAQMRVTRAAAAGFPQYEGRSAREVADKFIEAHRETWQIQAHHELRGDVTDSPMGSRVHYEVYQDGMPVIGLGIDIRLNRDLEVVDVENGYRPLEKADLNGRQLPVEEIVKETSERYKMQPDGEIADAESLKILFASEASTSPEVALVLPLRKGLQSYQVVIRASDGQLLGRTKSRSEF